MAYGLPGFMCSHLDAARRVNYAAMVKVYKTEAHIFKTTFAKARAL